METLIGRTRIARKPATKPGHRKSAPSARDPKLSPETEKIARLARRLKGAFGPTECGISLMPMFSSTWSTRRRFRHQLRRARRIRHDAHG